MYRKNIIAVFGLVFLLGLFFQYNRTDGFVRLSANTNPQALAQYPLQLSMQDKDSLAKDRFLLLYDPTSVRSVFLKYKTVELIEQQKKSVQVLPLSAAIDPQEKYDGVLLAAGNLEQAVALPYVADYVKNGGTAVFMERIVPGPVSNAFVSELGITSLGSEINTDGIKMLTNFLFGGQGFTLNGKSYQTNANFVTLADTAKVHMTSESDVPLLWENKSGRGKYIVYNGLGLYDKINRGLLTAALSRVKADYIYPVAAIKLFFIDDFPAPQPEGNFSKIYEELQLSTAEFFREVWWPMMLSAAAKYDVKYTGLIIESYGNNVTPPLEPFKDRKSRDNLIVYGRELLKAGGELGLHGYNHQPLAPAGYNQDNLGYSPWAKKEDMVLAMQELRRYVKEVYPKYDFRTYVPPSNILSPEGREAVKEAFPEMKIYASLYNGLTEDRCYYQEFAQNEDGTFEIPRVSSGYIMKPGMKWEMMNVLNAKGIFSHFVHPDELFYEESKDLTWSEMEKSFDAMLRDIHENYSWLRPCTASEGMEYLQDYFNLDYRIVETDGILHIYAWNYRGAVCFVLHSDKDISGAKGCTVEEIDDGVYLVRLHAPEAEIELQGGEEP